ncbi:MAG: amidohydrolase family protein [Verrucomicrobiota bacterium]
MRRIDTHHHFWRYKPELFPWITPERMVVGRDFLPEEFEAELAGSGIDGSVLVQNFRTMAETDWLIECAANNKWIRGVVGWLPLADSDAEAVIENYASREIVVGAREILQLPEASGLFESTNFHRGLGFLSKYDLCYDLLIGPWQFKESIQLADTHPDLMLVLSHLGKPPIASGELVQWMADFREMGKRPNVVCKLSGLPLEAKLPDWKPADLRPCIDLALEVFGPERLMFGSDWPPCLMATTYPRWVEVVADALAELSESERAAIWAGTAERTYGISATRSL